MCIRAKKVVYRWLSCTVVLDKPIRKKGGGIVIVVSLLINMNTSARLIMRSRSMKRCEIASVSLPNAIKYQTIHSNAHQSPDCFVVTIFFLGSVIKVYGCETLSDAWRIASTCVYNISTNISSQSIVSNFNLLGLELNKVRVGECGDVRRGRWTSE